MRNSAISRESVNWARPVTLFRSFYFFQHSLLVKCNKGSYVELQVSRFFPMLAWATLIYMYELLIVSTFLMFPHVRPIRCINLGLSVDQKPIGCSGLWLQKVVG